MWFRTDRGEPHRYTVAALPLTAPGPLNPLIAGAAVAFSGVFVVSNSLRLRRFRSASGQQVRPARTRSWTRG